MMGMWLVATALAQTPGTPPVPDLNAQLYRPAIDSEATLWTETTGGIVDARASARLAVHYVHRPFMLVSESEGIETAVVSDALQADAIAAYAVDRFRLAADMPIYLFAAGQLTDDGAGLGDLALDGRATLLDRIDAPLGLAVGARLTLPTTSVDAPLGAGGATAELQAMADLEVADDLLLAANLGTRIAPETDVIGASLKDQLVVRLGAGLSLTDATGLSGDLAAQVPYAMSPGDASAVPVEIMVGGWYALATDWVVRGGLGRGFTQGIGSSNARVVAMIGYTPSARPSRDTAEPVAEATPAAPTGRLVVRVFDEDGTEVNDVRWSLGDAAGPALVGGVGAIDHPPGTWPLRMDANDFVAVLEPITLAVEQEIEHIVVLRRPRVRLTGDRLVVDEPIVFEPSNAAIEPRSFHLLDELAVLLLDNPGLVRIRIVGHPAPEATAGPGLGEDRARSVRTHLIERGVSGKRLIAASPEAPPTSAVRPGGQRIDLVVERGSSR